MTDKLADQTPTQLVEELCGLLSVEPEGKLAFTGAAVPDARGRVFGGQVIGQALMAAGATVEDRLPHSLHAYFLRPGDNQSPIEYQVALDLDGGTFSNRRVIALQNGVPILSMAISFHNGNRGFTHRIAMPNVPAPDDLMSDAEWARKHAASMPPQLAKRFMRPRPLEFRRMSPPSTKTGSVADAQQSMWVRTVAALPHATQLLHRAILAFFSDMGLMSTALRPHGVDWSSPALQGASIDHALWFHDMVDVGEWMLYAMESPWADHGRGMNRGQIFASDGRLLASAAQESLNRLKDI
jgi:acyl-CoA thioesterase II